MFGIQNICKRTLNLSNLLSARKYSFYDRIAFCQNRISFFSLQKYCSSVSSGSSIKEGTELINQKKIRVLDLDLNYVETENNSSNVVLCMPGSLSSIEMDFIPLILALNKENYKVVAWDPPGYGLSRPPERLFSEDCLFKDAHYAVELMRILGHQKYSILGWSAGSLSAVYMAIHHPQVVRNLVMWGSSGYIDEYTQSLLRGMKSLGISVIPTKRRNKLLEIYGEETLKRVFEDWVNFSLTWSPDSSSMRDANNSEIINFTKNYLNKIRCPTLIIHGLKDTFIIPDHAHYLHENIPNSRLEFLENGAHNAHTTCGEEFTLLVKKFLDSVTA